MPDLPTGTVTFLFTDIEGSTRLWEEHPEAMRLALARHDALLRQAIEAHGGHVFKTVGDQFCAAFAAAPEALAAALAAQQALQAEPWPTTGPLRVRIALHTGAAEERDGDYFGAPLNRVARLLEAGHGGQVLLSQSAFDLARDHLPEGVTLRDLGEHRLKGLARPERVFQPVIPGLPADFSPLNSLDARPHNLPAQATPLIGREKEVAAVRSLLREATGRQGDDGETGRGGDGATDVRTCPVSPSPRLPVSPSRLVTLTGPGGTGKTRLGLQVAAELLDQFAAGVFFVALAPISDPRLVASAIAQTLGVREVGGMPLVESLKAFCRDKELLLLLDNFEQVLAAAPLVAELLAAAPRLKALVTSRAVLHLQGEHEFPVSPLALPPVAPSSGSASSPTWRSALPAATLFQYAAVELFIQRARAVRSDFAVTNENAPAVAEVCHRLDGLPLAIELAAARIKLFSPQALLTRLDSRFKLLTGGARDLPARQQTLRGAIAWSYDLLAEPEQKLFRRLAAFVGGCTLEAAEAVCNGEGDLEIDVLDGVASLVDKSLLLQEEQESSEPRFMMLETIREYGRECLAASGEEEAIRRQHGQFFLEFAERKEVDVKIWLDRRKGELDNLRAALVWGEAAGEEAFVVRLVLSVDAVRMDPGGAVWMYHGRLDEQRQWLEKALTRATALGLAAEKAELLEALSDIAYGQGDFAAAQSLDEQRLPIRLELGQPQGIAACYWHIGLVARDQAQYEEARAHFEQSLAIAREAGLKYWIVRNDLNLGYLAHLEGDCRTARELLEQILLMSREAKDDYMIGIALMHLGDVADAEGDYPHAERLLAESLAIWHGRGYQWFIARTIRRQGRVALHRGDPGAALAHFRETLVLHREVGNRQEIAACLEGMAGVAHARQQDERAVRLFGAAAALREAIGCPLPPVERAEYERHVSALRSTVEEAAFAAAWSAGRAMSLEEALPMALEEGES